MAALKIKFVLHPSGFEKMVINLHFCRKICPPRHIYRFRGIMYNKWQSARLRAEKRMTKYEV